jgi:hypothetical protein
MLQDNVNLGFEYCSRRHAITDTWSCFRRPIQGIALDALTTFAATGSAGSDPAQAGTDLQFGFWMPPLPPQVQLSWPPSIRSRPPIQLAACCCDC